MRGVKVLKFLQDNTKNKPNEDFLQVFESDDQLICAVADGVTRYVPEGASYPNPSPARDAAEEFCSASVFSVKDCFSLSSAFKGANKAIALMNHNLGITTKTVNYLENDFFGCQGVLGVLSLYNYEDSCNLAYGYIADCGLLVFDKNLFPIFLSENSVDTLEKFREGWGFSHRDKRKIFWAKTMRNRPHARHLTYGTLTGEVEALAYLRTGSLRLEPGDTVLFFSDGILPFVYSKDFRRVIQKQLQNDNKDKAHAEIAQCIDVLTKELGAKHVSNLDDDKAFVAFSVVT